MVILYSVGTLEIFNDVSAISADQMDSTASADVEVEQVEASLVTAKHRRDSVFQYNISETGKYRSDSGNEYNILEMIDYGSYGDIFKVSNETDKKTYAMKQIKFRGSFHNDPFIMSEIYCLTHLKHRNIIQLHEILVDVGEIHFVMEYAVNENLERYLDSKPDMEFHQKYKIYSQILQAVKYCHSMDIAHRDLTPVNVLLTEDMVVKLADFGLSVKCFTDDGSPMLCTDYIGHACYLSPEVLSQKPFLPKPADIWSLGVCLFYVLFQEVPFKGFQQEDILEEQLNHPWTDFLDVKTKDSPHEFKREIVKMIGSCLCVKANQRSNICDLIRLWDTVSSESLYET